jgi:hypothetical protein
MVTEAIVEFREAARASDVQRLAVVGIALLLASCVGTYGARGTWVKAGTDSEAAQRDAYACEREAVVRRTAELPVEVAYERCMRARGYVRAGEFAIKPPPRTAP